MRKLIATFATAGMLSMAAISNSSAAPIEGFEAQYDAVLAACSGPEAAIEDCEFALTAYSDALIAAGIAPTVAIASLQDLRADVRVRNAANPLLLAEIEDLYELLLPETGAVFTGGGGGAVPASAGGGGGGVASPS